MVQESAEPFVESTDFTTEFIPARRLIETDPIAVRTWLDENLSFDVMVYTDTAKSLDYLRQAVDLCQGLIYHMGNTSCLRWRHLWVDGPHLVRLGRSEIQCWTEGWCPSVGEYDGSAVYNALLNLVELRNTISHPDGDDLGNAQRTDWLLRRAQEFCVVLGCESAAVKVRQLRDALLAEANQSWQDLLDLCLVIQHPFCPELEFHPRHGKLLLQVLRRREDDPLQDPRIWDLGDIWARQTGLIEDS
ncbi:hypothetical protein F5B17DRAFT_385119 [Nemania serpens]|nr:hypothetical protein F5B17DRAFT_385119 [Nemania serpens]